MTSAEFQAARLRLGLTQSELGIIMGMGQSAVARLESGGRHPTRQQAAFMAMLLHHHEHHLLETLKAFSSLK